MGIVSAACAPVKPNRQWGAESNQRRHGAVGGFKSERKNGAKHFL
jgi:hypothetical protein